MLSPSNIVFLVLFCVIRSGYIFASENITFEVSEDSVPCEEGWTYYEGKCYRIHGYERRSVFYREPAPCSDIGGTIASIHSKEQNDFITRLSELYHTGDLYIGLNDREHTSHYVWKDESPVDYLNWNSGEPVDNRRKTCVVLKLGSNVESGGKWNKVTCDSNLPFICQKQTNESLGTLETQFCSAEEGGGFKFRDSCYTIVNEKMTWDDAENYCQNISNGHLVKILDLERDAYLNSLLPQSKDRRWLGIKIQNKLHPRWSSGFYVFYDHFDEPVESMGNNKCILRWNKNLWTSTFCNQLHPFICETSKGGSPVFPASSSELVCPDSTPNLKDFGGDFCYYFSEKQSLEWFDAQEECVKKGGILASIRSKEEEDIFRHLFKQGQKIYIGLNNVLTSGAIYLWSDGFPLNYTHWSSNEPKSSSSRCVELQTTGMSWNAIPCDTRRDFICQVQKVPPHTENEEDNTEKTETTEDVTETSESATEEITYGNQGTSGAFVINFHKSETTTSKTEYITDASKTPLNETWTMKKQNENISRTVSSYTMYILIAAMFIVIIVFGIAIYIFRNPLKEKLDLLPPVLYKKNENTKNYKTLHPEEILLDMTEGKRHK